jgi:hypothetical protein
MVLYAEAVKSAAEEDVSRARDPKRIPVSRSRPIESGRSNLRS